MSMPSKEPFVLGQSGLMLPLDSQQQQQQQQQVYQDEQQQQYQEDQQQQQYQEDQQYQSINPSNLDQSEEKMSAFATKKRTMEMNQKRIFDMLEYNESQIRRAQLLEKEIDILKKRMTSYNNNNNSNNVSVKPTSTSTSYMGNNLDDFATAAVSLARADTTTISATGTTELQK